MNFKITLWIVGVWKGGREAGRGVIVGVFDSKEKGLEACRTEDHLLGPIELNEDLGDDFNLWEGSYYPNVETLEEANERRAEDTMGRIKP